MSTSSSRLPVELECEIFETAAWCFRDDSELRLNLSLVARRAHHWTERIFFKVVALRTQKHATKFLQLVDAKPAGFFSGIVHALFLPNWITAECVRRILSACCGTRILACWVDYRGAPELPLLISRLPLCRLEIEFDHFLSIPLDTSAWRSSLTHLELTLWDHVDDPAKLSRLCRLSHLTHLAIVNPQFDSDMHLALARAVCSVCPNLQVVRLDTDDAEFDVGDEDPRIVVKADRYLELEENIKDWEGKLP
ncbi:hypothetical protein C8J57DRAFT_338306 [Mycena rebaudengoi]|nr:hypothetical protein C8J57DRAFT_338306 [Mycena rebaudengoi]